ncbi:MAG: RNA repair domain-containing protein, partial [Candidatus Bathyarchaeia archaeon]
MHPLRNILNKLVWSEKEKLEDYEITYIHRGVPGNSKSLKASSIIKIGKSWFIFKDNEEEKVIPFHRVILVVNLKTGECLWR